MIKNKPFSELSRTHAPAAFRSRLRARISTLERRAFIARTAAFIGLSLASLSAFVASCVYAWSMAMSSGFGQYVSLVFTDGSALAFSKELGLSLVESLPALGIALVLSAALASVWAVSRLVRESRPKVGIAFA